MYNNVPKHILGIGAALVDTILFVEDQFLKKHQLEKGSVVPIDLQTLHVLLDAADGQPVHTPGGSCANVIRALSQLGWTCALTGKIGTDQSADFILSDLALHRIEAHYNKTKLPTGQVLCFVTPDGERTMRDLLGASAAMQGDDLLPGLFGGKALVHIEGYVLFNGDLGEEAMRLAKTAGAQVSFDLANFKLVSKHKQKILNLLKEYVDIAFANAQEANELLGMMPKEACRELSTYCSYATITQGEGGCWVGENGNVQHMPAIQVPSVIDTTGAGDLFAAGFLDGILTDKSLEQCAWQGNFLASQIIGQQGATLSSEKWPELLTILRNQRSSLSL